MILDIHSNEGEVLSKWEKKKKLFGRLQIFFRLSLSSRQKIFVAQLCFRNGNKGRICGGRRAAKKGRNGVRFGGTALLRQGQRRIRPCLRRIKRIRKTNTSFAFAYIRGEGRFILRTSCRKSRTTCFLFPHRQFCLWGEKTPLMRATGCGRCSPRRFSGAAPFR